MRDPRVQRAHQPDLRPDPLDDPRHDPPTGFEVDFFGEYGLSWAGEGIGSVDWVGPMLPRAGSRTVPSPADARNPRARASEGKPLFFRGMESS